MATHDEIVDALERAIDRAAQPTKFPAMTYEQGVEAALRWAAGDTDEDPLDD